MDKSSLPLPQKRDLIYANSARLEKRSSVQLKHCLRDSSAAAAGKTGGPLRVQVERPQITSGYLRRRFVHTAKKAAAAAAAASGSPVTLQGSKAAVVGSTLYSAGVCVAPVTPESGNEGGGEPRSKSSGSASMTSKLLQLQERNRLIMARNQTRVNVPDVTLTSPLTVEIDAGDVTTDKSADSQRRPSSDLSTVSPIYHELDPLDSCYNISAAAAAAAAAAAVAAAEQQHTYQSISEVREEIARLEAAQRDSASAWRDSARDVNNATVRPENALVLPPEQTPGVLLTTRAGSDPDAAAKQTRSKSRSIFSKFWQSRRTARPPPPDENPAAARPLRASVSSRAGEALSPSTEDALLYRQQLSAWESNFATHQTPSPLVIYNSATTCDSRNNNLNSSADGGLFAENVESDYQNLPFSLRDQFYLSKTCDEPETGIEDRMRSVFANQNSVLYLRTFARYRQDVRAGRKYDVHTSDYDGWTNQGCRLIRVSHTDRTSGHEFGNKAALRDDAQPGCFFNSMYDNLQLVRMTSYDDHQMEISPDIWQTSEVCMDDSGGAYCTNVPTFRRCLGQLATELRFSSPCCGVRMAEMRAVWRRSQRVLGSSDSTDQGALLTPLRSVTDSNWELQHKRGSRFRDPSPRYTQVQARQDRMRIVEESEDDSNSQVLLMISSQELDNRECFGCDTSHSPTTAESEGNSTNETDWSVAEFKHSVAVNRKCSSPDKVEENLDENDDDSDPKQVLASKDNERRLKQPKPVRQSTRASQLNLCSTSNNSSATKLDTLRSGQESKENTDRAGLDCKTTTLLSNNRRTTDVQHRRQVKHAVVRHIRTVVGDHVTQLQRSFGPRTSEMLRAKSGSNIPRTKPKHHPTKDARSTERKETCAKARAKDACRNESGSNSQDQTATNDRYISDIVAESETGLGKELGTLLDSGPVEPTQPLTVSSADIGTTSEKTRTDEEPNSDSCGSLSSGKNRSSASSSLSPSLTSSQSSGSVVADSESESLSLSSCSRDFETAATTSTTTNNSASDPTSPSAEQNEDVEPSENKRRRGGGGRGGSHLVAPRTDAAKCLQRIELLRVEAKQRKHEICQTLRP